MTGLHRLTDLVSIRMDDPGRQLRRIRERLRLKYRDVEEASQQIARSRGRQEFSVGLSRLADIENKGTLPSLYRLYSLCVIYGLNFHTALTWYGIDLDDLAGDAAKLPLRETRLIDFTRPGPHFRRSTARVRSRSGSHENGVFEPARTTLGKAAAFAILLTRCQAAPLRFHRYGGLVYVSDSPAWFVYPDRRNENAASSGWLPAGVRSAHSSAGTPLRLSLRMVHRAERIS